MNKVNSDTRKRVIFRLAIASLAMGACRLATAQQQPAAAAAAEDSIELPTFTINETPANPYQSQQALSTSRVAMSIQDIPQTVSVVPHEMIEDTQGARMLDVAKYVTPIVESTLPFGGDRYMIRGFQVSQEFIDGSVISGADGYSMSLAPYNIERIEVIKGPNAILVPGGSPGGVMNPITKSPMAKNASSATVELGRYNGNALSFDVNRVISGEKGMGVRLVSAFWKNNLYIRGQFRNGYEISPSFSMNISSRHKLIIKGDFVQNRETNMAGLPIDPTIGSGQYAKIAPGLPRDWSFGDKADTRHRSTGRISAELLSTLTRNLTARFYVMGDHVRRIDMGSTGVGMPANGKNNDSINYSTEGSRNPATGMYESGVRWATSANADGSVTPTSTFVGISAPATWMYSRNTNLVDLEYSERHFKNDYAARFEGSFVKSTTIFGLAINSSRTHFLATPTFSRGNIAANKLELAQFPAYKFPGIQAGLASAGLGTDKTADLDDSQLYIYETLSFLSDRIQISGGLSDFKGKLKRIDTTGTALDATLGATVPSYDLRDTASSIGLVVKPTKQVSLFFARNGTGGTMPGSLSAGNNPSTLRVADGSQDEFGVKTSFFNGALTASFAHFDIMQKNYPVPNSEWYRLTAEGRTAEAAALQNPLYLDLTSKGWEFETTWAVNKSFTILGNYTSFKMRQPITEVRVRAVPDHAGGLYADYRFLDGVLKGFGVNMGLDYKGDVAGENTTGYTTTKPLSGGTKFVPNQPSFLVAGRTLLNVGFSFRAKDYTVRLTCTNATNKGYILAAGSRTSLVVGEPIAWKLSTTYKF